MFKYECDSRKVEKGQTFIAIKGLTVDGHDVSASYDGTKLSNGFVQISGTNGFGGKAFISPENKILIVFNSDTNLIVAEKKSSGNKFEKEIPYTVSNGTATFTYDSNSLSATISNSKLSVGEHQDSFTQIQ